MMTVDAFFKMNGRQFISMVGNDDELDRMGRTRRPREDHPIDICSFYGQKWTQESEEGFEHRSVTTNAQLRLEDTF